MATGYPWPIISWSRADSRPIDVYNARVLGNGNLVITDVASKHAGVYLCRATTPGTRNYTIAAANLTVQGAVKPLPLLLSVDSLALLKHFPEQFFHLSVHSLWKHVECLLEPNPTEGFILDKLPVHCKDNKHAPVYASSHTNTTSHSSQFSSHAGFCMLVETSCDCVMQLS